MNYYLTYKNCTAASNSTFESPGLTDFEKGTIITSISLSTFALLINGFSLVMFLRMRREEGTLRFMLLLLSASEVAFNTSNVSYEACNWRLSANKPFNTNGALLGHIGLEIVSIISLEIFLICRNWCIVLIAFSRFEVILKPFSRHQNGLAFNKCTLVVMYLTIWLTAAGMAFYRSFFYETFDVCFGNFIPTRSYIDEYPKYFNVFEICFYALQALIPTSLVFFVTVFMIYLFRRQASRLQGSIPGRATNYSKATRGVIILLVTFLVFESYTFYVALVKVLGKTQSLNQILILINNLVIILDSIFNFVAYMVGNTLFRKQVVQSLYFWRGRLRKRNQQTTMTTKSSNVAMKRLSFRDRITTTNEPTTASAVSKSLTTTA